MKKCLSLLLSFALLGSNALARGHGGSHHAGWPHRHGAHSSRPWSNELGRSNPVHRYHRSFEAKRQFWSLSGHPHGWPGHVVDHINPLACGGADAPSNMQWQTIAEARAKDKTERIGCHGGHR